MVDVIRFWYSVCDFVVLFQQQYRYPDSHKLYCDSITRLLCELLSAVDINSLRTLKLPHCAITFKNKTKVNLHHISSHNVNSSGQGFWYTNWGKSNIVIKIEMTDLDIVTPILFDFGKISWVNTIVLGCISACEKRKGFISIRRWWYFFNLINLCRIIAPNHDDVIKWKHFPRNWPFVREIHRSPVNFPHKGQWRGALMFSLIYAWINDWVNNHEAGDLRRQHGHYDVIVMSGRGETKTKQVHVEMRFSATTYRHQCVTITYFTHSISWLLMTWQHKEPGARPTKHISIEFEIRWNFRTL